MEGETLDTGHLFDDVDADEIGGGHLFDEFDDVKRQASDDLLHRDVIVYEGMTPWVTCHGSTTIPKYLDADGRVLDPATVSNVVRAVVLCRPSPVAESRILRMFTRFTVAWSDALRRTAS